MTTLIRATSIGGLALAATTSLSGQGTRLLRHPTLSWHSLKYPYMNETVIPTIKAARKRALKLAQTV